MLKSGDRFENFILSIDSIHKCINKIKQDIISDESLKGVHTLWLYELLKSGDGLTAAELAARSNIDRSLVSREIAALVGDGYVSVVEGKGKRGYNSRFLLTEKGQALAERIADLALSIQNAASSDVSDEELEIFYSVLEKIRGSLELSAKEGTL